MELFDIIVIGAGPGGYVAAISAARQGAKVAIVEKDDPGGLCLNWGCIPSKILLKTAGVISRMKHLQDKGMVSGDFTANFPEIIRHSRERVESIRESLTNLITSAGVTIFKGIGAFERSDIISVALNDGANISLRANRGIIIATGSQPRTLSGIKIDGDRIITSREALALTERPETLAIIGGGVIGCEMASFFAALGTKVTILEYMPQLLPGIDADISKGLTRCFKNSGIELQLSKAVESDKTIDARKILVAVGINPNIAALHLDKAGVQTMPGREFILIDPRTCQTNISGIYAIGDVAALRTDDMPHPALAHLASVEGEIAVEHILHGKSEWNINYAEIPLAIFTDPEIGLIGLTEENARKKYPKHAVISQQLRDMWMGIGIALEETSGITKTIVDETKYGRILGAHIMGPAATERIHVFAAAMRAQESSRLMARQIYAHPTFSEGIREALLALDGQAVHVPLTAQEKRTRS